MFMSESRYLHSNYESSSSAKMLKIEHDGNNNEFFSYDASATDYFEPYSCQYGYTSTNSAQNDYHNPHQEPQNAYYYYTPTNQQELAYNSSLVENCLNTQLNSSSCSYQAYQTDTEPNLCFQNQVYANSQNFDEYFYQNQSYQATNYHASSSNSDGSILLGEESDDEDDSSVVMTAPNGSQKRKRKRVLNKIQRAEATQREKRRMLKLNRAFEELRKVLPITEFAKNKLSRAETLKSAIEYIDRLAQLLAI